MTTEITIRPAALRDYPGTAAVFDEIHDLHRRALPHIFRAPEQHALASAEFEAVLADPEAGWLVAERAGEIIGFVKLRLLHTPDRPVIVARDFVEVDALAVRADQQRAGVGRALMAAADDWARERGIDQMQLNVWAFNAGAIAFYQELGYVVERHIMRRVIDNVNS